ncbi:MAG: Hsp70 family protein, partial [Myxococcaceae bacterium]
MSSEPSVGIDLGTTYSALATVENGRSVLIPNRDGGLLTPSMVGFTNAGERVIGERARLLAEEAPGRVAHATKRFIGRRWTPELAETAHQHVPYTLVQGPSGEVRIKLAGRVFPLTQISAMVLGELKLDAEVHFGRPVRRAVITVPANFDDGQRQATKEAARIAGLEVLRVVNEPTAAAVAYGLTKSFQGRALVFDLGGGTFDVSILEIQDGVFEVKATGGDSYLGGEDFDNRIVQWLLAQVEDSMRDVVAQDALSMQRLKVASERAKRELTKSKEAYISVEDLGDHINGKRMVSVETALTRDFFETLSEPLTRRCLNVCQALMRDAKLDPKVVDAVLLVGGMTRVPLIRLLVAEFFGKTPSADLNPDEVVARGAALHAAEIASQAKQSLLIDVASHSLGVEVLGGRIRRLIDKNTTVPVRAQEVFHPSSARQTEARIRIFQGEGATAAECAKLGEVVLRDLRSQDRGETPLEVSFELSSEGILSVRATDLTTGLSEAVQVEARTELSQNEIAKLREEQEAYERAAGEQRQEEADGLFRKLLERGERLAKFLEESAKDSPSTEATATASRVSALIEEGRHA